MIRLDDKFNIKIHRSAATTKPARNFLVYFESFLTKDCSTVLDFHNLAKSTIDHYSVPKLKKNNQFDLPMKDFIRLEMDVLYTELKVIYMGLKEDKLLMEVTKKNC